MTDTYFPDGLPAPAAERDGLDAPYWEGLTRHELWVQRCDDCGAFQWGPEWMCSACQSLSVGWAQTAPTGRIFSWERVWHPIHPAVRENCPYLVVLVELPDSDGIRMIGNLLGDPLQQVEIGAAVEGVFEDHPANDPPYTLLQWRVS
ncbi:MAG: Zn-ribbon domain-containing OB-fold protein [Acidimicrobiales bacterium]